MSDVVTMETDGAVALIALDNRRSTRPPTRCAPGWRSGWRRRRRTWPSRVIALYGRGRAFIAGADIREFGKPAQDPILPEVVMLLEASGKPVISVLHGVALGGGLEVALATHARIGIEGLRVGLPEVALGILPGAGGTQRTPRLVGIPAAIEIITSGRHVPAKEALKLGLIDRLEAGDPREVALAAAREVLDGTLARRRVGEIEVVPDDAAVEAAKAKVAAKSPHLFSPVKCVEAVAASTRPIQEGMAEERRLFRECLDSPQRAAPGPRLLRRAGGGEDPRGRGDAPRGAQDRRDRRRHDGLGHRHRRADRGAGGAAQRAGRGGA